MEMKSKYKVSSALGIYKSLSEDDVDLLYRLSTERCFFFSHIWIAGVTLLKNAHSPDRADLVG